MKLIKARRQKIPVDIIPQHEVDQGKVLRYSRAMRRGDTFPPVVVARYGDSYMPLDGHHRMYAAQVANIPLIDAFVVSGRSFERADLYGDGRAENDITCDGIPAMFVADRWVRE